MKTENYLNIDVAEISQVHSGIVLIGKLKFKELRLIHRLTERKESLIDPFGEKPIPIDTSREDEEFQRQLSSNKLNKIATYLEENFNELKKGKAIGLFPTSIIVSLEYDIDFDPQKINNEYLEKIYSEDLSSCLINDNKSKLFIPKNNRIALIVDGQHRFYGVKKFYDSLRNNDDREKIDNFEFVTTFLIGFDIYDIGKIFATVNFTQKPVNRSLYYDIFGSVPDTERNDIKLSHDLALHLNNSDKSPIKGMIKMLGKGYGLFSQAFFVEKILMHFKENGIWEKIYSDYIINGKEYKKLPIFMRIFLSCLKEKYEVAWPKSVEKDGKSVYSPYNYNYILCKSTGMGAILRLLRDIYPLVENLSELSMKQKICKIFAMIEPKRVEEIFSKDGIYGGTGGEGLQNKLYKHLRKELLNP